MLSVVGDEARDIMGTDLVGPKKGSSSECNEEPLWNSEQRSALT